MPAAQCSFGAIMGSSICAAASIRFVASTGTAAHRFGCGIARVSVGSHAGEAIAGVEAFGANPDPRNRYQNPKGAS